MNQNGLQTLHNIYYRFLEARAIRQAAIIRVGRQRFSSFLEEEQWQTAAAIRSSSYSLAIGVVRGCRCGHRITPGAKANPKLIQFGVYSTAASWCARTRPAIIFLPAGGGRRRQERLLVRVLLLSPSFFSC